MKTIAKVEIDWATWGLGIGFDFDYWEFAILIGPFQIVIGWDL